MIEIALVEDEEIYISSIRKMIEQYMTENGEEINLTVFHDGMELLDEYDGKFSIILMDIMMKFLDGMTTAEKIRTVDKEVVIMFITNSTQYAIRGYAVDALDYILKPVTYFSFSKKLEKAVSRIKQGKNKFITLSYKNMIKKFNVSDIYFVESQGHMQIFHTRSEDFSIRDKIDSIEEKLAGSNFFRSNKGYIVNMNHVSGVDDNCCIVNGERLVISRNKKKAFMDELTKYMGTGKL